MVEQLKETRRIHLIQVHCENKELRKLESYLQPTFPENTAHDDVATFRYLIPSATST